MIGPEEMAQLVNSQPHKHEGPSSDPKQPHLRVKSSKAHAALQREAKADDVGACQPCPGQ